MQLFQFSPNLVAKTKCIVSVIVCSQYGSDQIKDPCCVQALPSLTEGSKSCSLRLTPGRSICSASLAGTIQYTISRPLHHPATKSLWSIKEPMYHRTARANPACNRMCLAKAGRQKVLITEYCKRWLRLAIVHMADA